MDTKAEAKVPTTKAEYDPLNRIITTIMRKVSRQASRYLLRSNFHLMNAMLKNTANPIMANSIKTPNVKIYDKHSRILERGGFCMPTRNTSYLERQ